MEILHTSEVVDRTWEFFILLITMILVGIGAWFISAYTDEIVDKNLKHKALFLSTLLFVIGVVSSILLYHFSDKVVQHKVIIHDMTQFDFDRYEIVDVEVDVYTIIEKRDKP